MNGNDRIARVSFIGVSSNAHASTIAAATHSTQECIDTIAERCALSKKTDGVRLKMFPRASLRQADILSHARTSQRWNEGGASFDAPPGLLPEACRDYSINGFPTGDDGNAEVAWSRESAGVLWANANEELTARTAKTSECRSLFMVICSLKFERKLCGQ